MSPEKRDNSDRSGRSVADNDHKRILKATRTEIGAKTTGSHPGGNMIEVEMDNRHQGGEAFLYGNVGDFSRQGLDDGGKCQEG